MAKLLAKSEFSNLYHNLTYSLMSSISGHVAKRLAILDNVLPMRKLSGSTNTSAVWSHFKVHRRRKVTRIKLGVTIATSPLPGNTLLFLGTFNGITRINKRKKTQ